MKSKLEREADSLMFVLANKPWTAMFLIAAAAGLFVAGAVAGAVAS